MINEGLNAAEALAPGRGSLDLRLFANEEQLGGSVGYQHKFNENWAAFAEGLGGWNHRTNKGFGSVIGGIRGYF